MFGLGINEIIIVAVVIGIFFGGKKLTDFARSAGRVTGEFKKGKMEMESELENAKNELETPTKTSKK